MDKKIKSDKEFLESIANKKNKYSYKDYLSNKKIANDENSANDIDNEEEDMTEIINNVWLGNYKAAYNKKELDKHNIKYIINITDTIECPFDDKYYLYIPIRDKYSCNLASRHFIIKNYFRAFLFINDALNHNKGVLVHCKKGHHRSANLILFYLIYRYNLGYIEALIYIKSKRPQALCRKTCINKWGMVIYKFIIMNNKSNDNKYIDNV